MYSTFLSHPVPSHPLAGRPAPASLRPARAAPRGNQTTLSTVTDVTFERARVRPSRAFDAPLSRDMTRDFLVPDSFADLCVDDDDDDETRGVVARMDDVMDVAALDVDARGDAVEECVRTLCDGEPEVLVEDGDAFARAYALCRCVGTTRWMNE